MDYFMTDIHGDYTAMIALLEQPDLNWGHDKLVLGGDMINRGPQSADVLQYTYQLQQQYPQQITVLCGNHEQMLLDYYRHDDPFWLRFGGKETLKDLQEKYDSAYILQLVDWLEQLPIVHEDEQYVYTHSGLDIQRTLDQQTREILWMTEADLYQCDAAALLQLTGNRPIVHGHTPVERIYFDSVRLNCDLGSQTYPIVEARGVALVNLTHMNYQVYRPFSGKVEQHRILHYDSSR
ncbi:metallophosphoesterase [Paenibacillus sp. WLX2291]|uniref:metallophosphoesterase n=1 Tax=Paenibacillus sp. WLX2291 TaxID=3296934 RepID=UPI0039841372